VKDMHLRFVVSQPGGAAVEGIGFGMAAYYEMLSHGPVDLLYTIDENDFHGTTKLQIKVLDVRPAGQ